MSSALERLGRFAARRCADPGGRGGTAEGPGQDRPGERAGRARGAGEGRLFDGWYPRIDAPIKGRRTVLDTSGHRPLFEQPDDFLDYLTDEVVPSTAQLPRS